jgi:hypothetical protein
VDLGAASTLALPHQHQQQEISLLELWLNTAFDWSERRDVPMTAVRDEAGDWHVQLTFRDTNGFFTQWVPMLKRDPNGRMTREEYAEATLVQMQKAAITARRNRFQKFNKRENLVTT